MGERLVLDDLVVHGRSKVLTLIVDSTSTLNGLLTANGGIVTTSLKILAGGALTPVGGPIAATRITDTELVVGQIVFALAGGTLAGDSNLFWDNATKRLGIGVAPSQPLDVGGQVRVRSGGVTIDAGGETITAGNLTVAAGDIQATVGKILAATHDVPAGGATLNLGTVTATAVQTGRTGQKLGFYGTAPVVQAAHPVTLGDVITALANLGLTA